ncbi:hypothetical protein IG922_004720 [Salmonella enterica]|nr:hypothetical protein [Salmonella enterica]
MTQEQIDLIYDEARRTFANEKIKVLVDGMSNISFTWDVNNGYVSSQSTGDLKNEQYGG